jgi:CheY-like chemotaxis protein
MRELCPACDGAELGVSMARQADRVIVHRECPLCGFTTRTEEPPEPTADNLTGLSILVVEDTPDSREMLRVALELCGARVRTAASATEGKQALNDERPDLMISDIAMPDNGIELIRAVKAAADERSMDVPVIAVTAHRGRREELLKEGFAELVEKPIDPLLLCRTIRRHTHVG